MVRQPLLIHQLDFIKDVTSPVLSLTGGLGSGKTEAAVIKSLYLGYLNAPYAGLVIEPTYDQIENVYLDTMYKILKKWKVPASDYNYNSKTHNFDVTLNGVSFTIRCRSADKAKNIAGANVAWLIVDEADFIYENVMNQLKARVRVDAAPFKQICFVGTPEKVGGWWQTLAEIQRPSFHRLIRAHTMNNYFLPENFAEVNLGHLSDQEQKQYLGGHWISLQGKVYPDFSETEHVVNMDTVRPEPTDEFVMACDFGTGLMAWVLGVLRNGKVYFFDEIAIPNIDTHEATQRAIPLWQKFFQKWFGWHLDPYAAASKVDCYIDPAGDPRRDTTSSDGKFMMNAGFNLASKPKQIPVNTRVQTMRYRVKQNKLYFFKGTCPHALKSILNQGYDKWGKPSKWHPREGAKGLDHSNDAIGYMCVGLWPLRYTGQNQEAYSY